MKYLSALFMVLFLASSSVYAKDYSSEGYTSSKSTKSHAKKATHHTKKAKKAKHSQQKSY